MSASGIFRYNAFLNLNLDCPWLLEACMSAMSSYDAFLRLTEVIDRSLVAF